MNLDANARANLGSAVLFSSVLAANAAPSGTLLVLNKSDNTVSLLDPASEKLRRDDSDRQRSTRGRRVA
jgi:DNA-binding beta-propeller fold protein YncE